MANYLIIGGDGKEYGPVTDADVRQWIVEGRLNEKSLAKSESDAEFRPLQTFPEFADVFGATRPPETAPLPSAGRIPFTEHDYELDLGGCIAKGWAVFKENFSILFLGFFVATLVEMACGGFLNIFSLAVGNGLTHAPAVVQVIYHYLLTFLVSLVMGPLMGGLFLVYLKVIRGQPTGVGEVFAGFQRAFIQLFLGSAMVALIVGGCMLPFRFVWLMKAQPVLEQMQQAQNNATAMEQLLPQLASTFVGTLPVFLICLVPMLFLQTCWAFTLPLIIDREMDFGAAMKTSWKMVIKHWWQVFGLTILVGLISLAGVLGCCIGILFTAPIGIAALMYAYETIFSEQKN